jgi:hypothetical protein
VATVTLVYDSGAGLPCETLFKSELSALRREGRRLVEVSRLAMDSARQPPRALLVRLFNILYIHARLVRSHTDLLVEVVPRHVAYYQRLLEFEPLGPARKWPRGRDVMATLLRLDLLEAARRIEQARRGAPQRLYRHALSAAQEGMIVGALGVPDTDFPLPTPDPLRPEA